MIVRTRLVRAEQVWTTDAGNPVWDLYTDHGRFRTKPDSSVSKQVAQGLEPGPACWAAKSVMIAVDEAGQATSLTLRTRQGDGRRPIG